MILNPRQERRTAVVNVGYIFIILIDEKFSISLVYNVK